MFSLRCSRAARHPAAPLPAPRSFATIFLGSPSASLTVTLAVTLTGLVGCSSAGDSYQFETQSTGAATDAGASASAGDSNQSTTAVSSAGSDPGSVSDGSDDTTSGGTGMGEPPPEEEPELGDMVAQQEDTLACDEVTPVSIGLRTQDAAATVSPTLARDAALSGWLSLSGIRIRPWEFFNYYSFDYPPAEPGLVTVTPQLSYEPGDELWQLQVGVATEAMPAEKRPPLHLTLALDNSNSMAGKAQDLLRATGKAIAGSLRAGDTLSIVTWNAKTATLLELHPVSGPDDPIILDKLDQLEIGGSAELYSGLMSAYKLATAAYDPAHWNRVVLVSDGGATATETDLIVIAEQADKQPGIYLSGVGVGDPSNYRSDLMDAAAHAGRGASLFVGSVEEADKRFGPQFVRTLGAAVRSIDVHIDLPPGFQLVSDPTADKLNDPLQAGSLRLAPNASLVMHRSLTRCNPVDPAAKLLVRVSFVDEATGELKEVKSAVKLETLLAEQPGALAKGAAVQAYASALQRWQISPADLAVALQAALERLAAAQSLLPNDVELGEIATVLGVLGQG